MTLRDQLREGKEAVVRRWLDDALDVYPEQASAAFQRQQDPFANPVGHSLRTGTVGILEALLDGMDAEKIHECLHEIIRIRAVQQFSASSAVSWVFALKGALRAELGGAAADPRHASELAEIEGQVDRIALAAFDIFVECREQVYELRVNEVKRRVSWVVEKMNERHPDSELAPVDSAGELRG